MFPQVVEAETLHLVLDLAHEIHQDVGSLCFALCGELGRQHNVALEVVVVGADVATAVAADYVVGTHLVEVQLGAGLRQDGGSLNVGFVPVDTIDHSFDNPLAEARVAVDLHRYAGTLGKKLVPRVPGDNGGGAAAAFDAVDDEPAESNQASDQDYHDESGKVLLQSDLLQY